MRTEPAAVGALVAAAVNLVVFLLLNEELTLEQQAAIATVVTLLAGLFIRSKVTPTG